MTTPSPFMVARETSNNLGNAFNRVKDENAIEKILSGAMNTGDPQVIQNSIGQILSQVSPERQGQALQYLQNTYAGLQQKQELQKRAQAAQSAGIDPNLSPELQKIQYENKLLDTRAKSIMGNPGVGSSGANANAGGMPRNSESNLRSVTDDQLVLLSGVKGFAEPAKQELKRRQEERNNDRADTRENRKETLPLRQGIIEAANLARESIRNKQHLSDIIDRGNIDDPSFAIFASNLPLNLGKRMLSNDTVEYKGGLVDEFGDLKNIFKGATRVKEVELYEDKLPDIYLNDGQKKAILKSRINASKVPIIREEAAAEVEEKFPNLTALQFNKRVDEIAKPKIDALFNTIWGEQKAIIDAAEDRKQVPLDPRDPDDKAIMLQIKIEAGGDKEAARQLAKKKGYKIVGEK